jgi:hypothetical protein
MGLYQKPGTSSLFVVILLLSEYSSDLLSFSKGVSLVISLTQVLTWIVIAAVVGFVGELLARRRAPDGILGCHSSWVACHFPDCWHLALPYSWRAISEWCPITQFHHCSSTPRGHLERVCAPSCPSLLFTLLSARRVRSLPTTASLVLVFLIACVVSSHVEVTSHFAPRGGIHFDITPYVVNSAKQTSTTPSDEGMRDDGF